MAYTKGFWAGGMVGTADRMNSCLLGWGLYSEFPTATADNKGALSLATDRNMIYYSNGAQWVQTAIAPPASLTKGDIIFFDGTKWDRLPPGTQGQVLTTQGAGANPVWGAAATGATQALVTRTANTTYRNTSGKVMVVTVTARVRNTGGVMYEVNVYCDATSPPGSPVANIFASTSGDAYSTCITFVVPPGYYYRAETISSGSGGMASVGSSWTEWTLG